MGFTPPCEGGIGGAGIVEGIPETFNLDYYGKDCQGECWGTFMIDDCDNCFDKNDSAISCKCDEIISDSSEVCQVWKDVWGGQCNSSFLDVCEVCNGNAVCEGSMLYDSQFDIWYCSGGICVNEVWN